MGLLDWQRPKTGPTQRSEAPLNAYLFPAQELFQDACVFEEPCHPLTGLQSEGGGRVRGESTADPNKQSSTRKDIKYRNLLCQQKRMIIGKQQDRRTDGHRACLRHETTKPRDGLDSLKKGVSQERVVHCDRVKAQLPCSSHGSEMLINYLRRQWSIRELCTEEVETDLHAITLER